MTFLVAPYGVVPAGPINHGCGSVLSGNTVKIKNRGAEVRNRSPGTSAFWFQTKSCPYIIRVLSKLSEHCAHVLIDTARENMSEIELTVRLLCPRS